jgi:hypothetical protein
MGEYVALLDSDDVWGDGFLSASIGAIEAYDCDLVWSNYRIVSLSGEIDCENQFREQRGYLAQYRNSGGPWHLVQGQAATKLFSRRLPLIPSAAVMRRRFAQIEPAEWVRAGPDLYFFPLNVLRSNQRVAFGDEVAWTQRIGTNNIRQGSNKQRSLLESDIQVKQALHSDPLWDVCERQALADRIADDLFSLSYHERLDGAFKPAVEHLLESFWLRPNFWMAKELAKIAWTAAASVIRPD